MLLVTQAWRLVRLPHHACGSRRVGQSLIITQVAPSRNLLDARSVELIAVTTLGGGLSPVVDVFWLNDDDDEVSPDMFNSYVACEVIAIHLAHTRI